MQIFNLSYDFMIRMIYDLSVTEDLIYFITTFHLMYLYYYFTMQLFYTHFVFYFMNLLHLYIFVYFFPSNLYAFICI